MIKFANFYLDNDENSFAGGTSEVSSASAQVVWTARLWSSLAPLAALEKRLPLRLLKEVCQATSLFKYIAKLEFKLIFTKVPRWS